MLDKNNSSLECDDEKWMKRAFELAKKAESIGEVPVGAVLVSENTIIGEGYNSPISTSDATAHAEINAIRNACASMCAGAIVHSRIDRVVIAAKEPRAGAAGSVLNILQNEQLNHRCEVETGLMQEQSSSMLKAFFKSRRK